MKRPDRQIINREQINRFFQSYYSEWRHIQVLAIEKKLRNKYTFYADIIEIIKRTDESAGDSIIAQEISNGLMFEAVQQCLQYIEDLFALIRASENPDYFIRNIINYDAGVITNEIKSPKTSREKICKEYYFPYGKIEKAEIFEQRAQIYECVDYLISIVKEISEFYKKHVFFYNQFKHGLSIALRPYSDFTSEQIKKDKEGTLGTGAIIALDSLNLKLAAKNQYGRAWALMFPHLTPTIQLHSKELQNENNLLRFVLSPPGLDIDKVLGVVKMTKNCLQILIHNFLLEINGTHPMNFRLPDPKDNGVIGIIFPN